MNDSGSKVVVSPHFGMMHGLGVWLLRRQWFDGASVTTVADPMEVVWTRQEEGVMLPPRPSLLLTDDFGRALLDELTMHYGGHSDVRSLRTDYDAERKRVDTLTDAIIQVAHRG